MKHFLNHWYAWPIVVIAGGWLVAVVVTLGIWLIGPDPAPTIEELEGEGKITTRNQPTADQIARADALLKEIDDARGGKQ